MYFLFFLLLLLPIGYGIYYYMKQGNSNQVTSPSTGDYSSNAPTGMIGGRRKKRGNKKSTMSTTGVYVLLGAVLVGYITSKFV